MKAGAAAIEPAEQFRGELREAVRRCVEHSGGPRPYLVGEPGTVSSSDHGLWRLLAGQIGITGLAIPEALGGAGGSQADVAAAAEELGRGLAPVPFFSTVALATSALLIYRDEEVARTLLSRIAAGGSTATLAFCGQSGSWAAGSADVRAEPGASSWRLTGRLALVVDGADADVLLMPARTGSGLALFAVERTAAGMSARPSQTLDLTRPMAAVTLQAAEAELVGAESGAEARLGTGLDLALALMAAEQTGGAQRCLDETVGYVKQRVQFGRPVGSFQAVKHQLVDVLLAIELARSAAEVAAAAADAYLALPGEQAARALALAASLAKATCSEAYSLAAEKSVHLHGGIGFTWEHDAHLHYRRARAAELFLGTPDQHRDRLAGLAGLGAPAEPARPAGPG